VRTLLIDDTRTEAEVGRVDMIARNYWEGLRALLALGPWDMLLLDHDLASFDGDREYTGMDVVGWLEEFPQYKPRDVKIVSSNPVGRQRMATALSRLYGRTIR
jgi:hypothetical protein